MHLYEYIDGAAAVGAPCIILRSPFLPEIISSIPANFSAYN